MTEVRSGLLRPRLVLAVTVMLSLAGVFAWMAMPRQEDPTFPARYGYVQVLFPGADADVVQRLIAEPLEDQLSELDEVYRLGTVARSGAALVTIELRPTIYDTDAAWDEVRVGIEKARREFPPDAQPPFLETKLVDGESIVIAVTGSTDYLELRHAARRLKKRLNRIPNVARTVISGDPGEQVIIEFNAVAAERVGITQPELARQLQSRNVTIPGGTVRMGPMTASLRPETEFRTIEEIRSTPVLLPSGAAVALGEISTVRRSPEEPVTTRVRHKGEMAVVVGVIPRPEIHLIDLGKTVREELETLRAEFAPLKLEEVTFQPDYVGIRLTQLGGNLLISMAVVAVLLLLTMGRRSALLVSSTVPLVTLSALALYWLGGGVLHQMSIAAFVIALGILVDNAIVMVENIQARIDNGATPKNASRDAVRELAIPLLTATGTTVAAFLPMLLARGVTADFTRALPVIIIIALTFSLVYAVLVTPTLGGAFLRRAPTRHGRWTARLGRDLGALAVRRHYWVLIGVGALVAATIGLSSLVEQQFFPAADRNQLVVEVRLPEGSSVEAIDEVTQTLEKVLREREDLLAITTFVGRSVPRFYYNVAFFPRAPHLAHLLLTTRNKHENHAVIEFVRSFMQKEMPHVQTLVRELDQGPMLVAPVEVQIYGPANALAEAAELVTRELKQVPGAIEVRRDMDFGAPTLGLDVIDAAASRYALARVDVAMALLGQTRGLAVGQFRGGDDAVPILLRSSSGEESSIAAIKSLTVASPTGQMVPIGQVASPSVDWRPAIIESLDGRRLVRVLADLESGVPFSRVLNALDQRLAAVDLPDGVDVNYGGAAEGAEDANSSQAQTLPFGVLLMLVFLLWEFNSFRRVCIVLATVPLAAVGIVPGLIVGGQPFGFMSLLGVIALAGIVVNNAIVLIDVVERERAGGSTVEGALCTAVESRARPILLTTATTIAGLVPLAFSDSSLWPPLAWAMISGLVASTLLTLLAVPALYRVLFRRESGVHPTLREVKPNEPRTLSPPNLPPPVRARR